MIGIVLAFFVVLAVALWALSQPEPYRPSTHTRNDAARRNPDWSTSLPLSEGFTTCFPQYTSYPVEELTEDWTTADIKKEFDL